MDWWIIEYDDKDSDSHVFMKKITDEFGALMKAAGLGPAEGALSCSSEISPDNIMRFYVNPEGAKIVGVRELLQRYDAKQCSEPTEPRTILGKR